MIEIRFVCNLEKLTPAEKPVLAAGDVNAVQLRVDFCQKWDRYAKAAVFFTEKNPNPIEVPMLQNACIVPAEVLAKSGVFYFGVRGVHADTSAVLTSDVVGYRVTDGTPTGVDHGPTPDVYQQILTGYGKLDNFKQNKLSWVSDADIDAMFAGTYEGLEEEDPEGDGYFPGFSETDNSPFGTPYTSAARSFDLSKDGAVRMYLFATVGGYDAVVTGEGSIWSHSAPKQEIPNPNGLIDVIITDDREYAAYVDKINRLHIAAGVTSIGAHFMHGAYNLKHLIFEDSTRIIHLGVNAFAETQIGGRYEFPNLEDETLAAPFESCPKLEGLTLSSNVKTIAARSFGRCLGLRYVDGLAGVTSIEEAAFLYCTSLEWLDVITEQVALRAWAFMLTPNEAEADGVALAEADWMSQGALCFAQNEWGGQLNEIQAVTAERVAFPIPESDDQHSDRYHQWGVFPMIYQGKWYSGGQRASGCCGIFCLYHIYNIRHPNAQYDTFHDFIQNEIAPKKIKVTQEIRDALEATPNGQILLANRPGIYEVGKEITALDLPMALDDDTETWGEIGTAHWGICEVLGWDATEKLFNEYSGADMKQLILDELHSGRPVQMEIVGDADIGHNMHAVVAIGYDPTEDKLQIIDTRGEIPADISPMVYWLPFEALITPHEKSAVWTFEFKEATMADIDKSLKKILAAATFRIESGEVTLEENIATSNGAMVTGLLPSKLSPDAKIIILEATNEVISKIESFTDKTLWYFITDWKVCLFSPLFGDNKNSLAALKPGGVSITRATASPTITIEDGRIKYTSYSIVGGKYRWKAYYWNE